MTRKLQSNTTLMREENIKYDGKCYQHIFPQLFTDLSAN